MYARFALQISVCILPRNEDGNAFYACFVSVKIIKHLDLELFTLAVAAIHSVKHFRPILRLCSACAGMNGENGVVSVVFAGKKDIYFLK